MWGATYDIARWSVTVLGQDTNNVLRDSLRHACAWGQCAKSVTRWLYNCDNKLGQARWQTVYETNVCAVGVMFTLTRRLPEISSKRNRNHSAGITKEGKKSLFTPGWRFPRIPVPRWPLVAAWLPSWWRRWRRMRCGRKIVSPSCRSFKSIFVFIKAFKLLIAPLSDLLLWRDRFVSTSSDRCVFMVQSFAYLLRFFEVTALIHWSLKTLCNQWKFPWFLVPTSFWSCCNVRMVFQCDFIVLNDTFLTPPKICQRFAVICHRYSICPECFL